MTLDELTPAVDTAGPATGDDAPAAGAGQPPDVAREIFGPVLPLAIRYAELLAGPAVVRGLLGPREAERLWDRHLLNCAVIAEFVPAPSTLLDIGSGAGLPGIVLAMLLPDVQVTLLEPMARRVTFLEECVTELGLGNTNVVRMRAEEAHGQVHADVVTARAVAPLDRLARLTVPLARPGGMVLAVKGARAAAEAATARPVLRQLGVRDVSVLRAGVDLIDPPATVIRLITGPQADNRPTAGGKPGGSAGSRRRRSGGARG
ncbi:MAG TPA: 16S rRNA (guanine(527)-N(7))-methyltransferase RsmG [Streptosporangiaceae bacterium]|jgi:16S rRNA (guanine527-N7)-methyltransferase